MLKKIGKILSTVLTVVLVLIVAASVYTAAMRTITGNPMPTVLGYGSAVVISGSMEPTISINDMIITKAQKEYKVDDVISFRDSNSVTTHRITEITEDGYITQGDANNSQDTTPIKREAVIGKVVGVIPFVGIFIGFIQTPGGMVVLLMIAIAILALPSVIRWILADTKGTHEAEEEKEAEE